MIEIVPLPLAKREGTLSSSGCREPWKRCEDSAGPPRPLANMVILSLRELKEMGYKMVIYPTSAHMAAIRAMQEVSWPSSKKTAGRPALRPE